MKPGNAGDRPLAASSDLGKTQTNWDGGELPIEPSATDAPSQTPKFAYGVGSVDGVRPPDKQTWFLEQRVTCSLVDLRDYLAAQALAVIPGDLADPEELAREAYRIADAMMKAREIK